LFLRVRIEFFGYFFGFTRLNDKILHPGQNFIARQVVLLRVTAALLSKSIGWIFRTASLQFSLLIYAEVFSPVVTFLNLSPANFRPSVLLPGQLSVTRVCCNFLGLRY